MKTYKLPIIIESQEDKDYIDILCQQQSIIVRSSYNAIIKKNKTLKQLDKEMKLLNGISEIDSWFIRCGILRGKSLTKNKSLIFGGKKNFIDRIKGKKTKEEWKEKRIYSLDIQGEENQGGNRKFNLDIIGNNKIIFKPNRNRKIEILLPNIKKKWKRELEHIEEIKCCYSVRLKKDFIEIIIDENIFKYVDYTPKNGRIMGIDLNPDWIGYNITDFPNENVVIKGCYETSDLNKKSGKSSNSKESKYLTNKRKHEYIHICHEIIKNCIHYRVEKLAIEDLNIKGGNLGNKNTNRKNNLWMRKLIVNKLKMLGNIYGVEVIEVNPVYSSVIGNSLYNDFDPVGSSREISRRGYWKFVKGKFYPSLESVKHQWKEMVTENIKTWKDFTHKLKTLKFRYRVPLDNNKVVCRHENIKRLTNLYFFI